MIRGIVSLSRHPFYPFIYCSFLQMLPELFLELLQSLSVLHKPSPVSAVGGSVPESCAE